MRLQSAPNPNERRKLLVTPGGEPWPGREVIDAFTEGARAANDEEVGRHHLVLLEGPSKKDAMEWMVPAGVDRTEGVLERALNEPRLERAFNEPWMSHG